MHSVEPALRFHSRVFTVFNSNMFKLLQIEQWQTHFSDELSEGAIRKYFKPAEKYRISRYVYPASTVFSGGMMSGICFVIRGQCSITIPAACVSLNEGEFVRVPAGSYSLRVDSQNELELVFVWELPITESQ